MTELHAETHFEALRDAVWARFRSRHGIYSRERFEDAYAEWWTRELERAAAGRPSRAEHPVAFVTEAVHRVLLDEARARARGLARHEKGALELVDIEDQLDVAGIDDTAARAHHEAVVHRILALVREQLSARELQVFVWSYLYLQTSERTAAALGLSEPRVKKDRRKVAAKVGAEVWRVLAAELPACDAYSDKKLLAVCEVLTDHVEDCAECAPAVGRIRRGAVAAVAPFEVLALADPPAALLDVALAKAMLPLQRAVETLGAMPAGGRAAAAAVLVTASVGGGAAVAVPERAPARPARPVPKAVVTPTPTPESTSTPAPVRTAVPVATATATPRPVRKRRRPRPAATAAAVATPPPAAPAPAPAAPAPAAPPPATGEFGFEQH